MTDMDVKNVDFWEEVIRNQPTSYKIWFNKEKEYLNKIITLDSKVLDIGCGDGRSILDIISITQNIVGLDYDEKAVSDAKNNLSKYPTVKIIKENATSLPFDSESFDFIICMGTFANFADKKFDTLNEMRRVLKSSGKIIISVYSEDALTDRIELYKSIGIKIREIKGGTVIFDESFKDNISEQFSEQELRDIFSRANLKVNNMEKTSIAYLCTLSK